MTLPTFRKESIFLFFWCLCFVACPKVTSEDCSHSLGTCLGTSLWLWLCLWLCPSES